MLTNKNNFILFNNKNDLSDVIEKLKERLESSLRSNLSMIDCFSNDPSYCSFLNEDDYKSVEVKEKAIFMLDQIKETGKITLEQKEHLICCREYFYEKETELMFDQIFRLAPCEEGYDYKVTKPT